MSWRSKEDFEGYVVKLFESWSSKENVALETAISDLGDESTVSDWYNDFCVMSGVDEPPQDARKKIKTVEDFADYFWNKV